MAGKWFENLKVPPEHWEAFKTAFLEQFTNNNTSITLRNQFRNIKQEPSKSVMTYFGKFNKLLRRIRQLETNEYYSNTQILDQFIARLKDKLIKKVCLHTPKDLATAIQQAKNYEMAMEEANSTTAAAAITTATKISTPTMTQSKQLWTTIQQPNPKLSLLWNSRTLKIGIINITFHHSNLIINYYQLTIYQDLNTKITIISPSHSQSNSNTNNHPHNIIRISSNNQLVLRNSVQPRPNHYHTQPSYLTIPEEQNFYHIALLEDRVAAQQQNPSHNHTTIPPARIAKNANLSDIFSFEFKVNEFLFLLSNTAANEQKAITAMYTEAEVKGKTICLILNSGSVGIIVTVDGIKKTPVGEIDNFLFTLDRITIPIKVLVMNTPQYQALVRNDWLQKTNAKLDWKTQELQISYQRQYVQVPATCGTFNKCSEKAPAFEFESEEEKPIIKTFMALGSMSNWAKETEQEHFTPHSEPETPG
ncbi:hypothetical protein G9A89_020843 [Geosiphon pyriformis]|nr:hypothetical protein G9A89_020843 [Geosiphon pyriformis]